MTLDVFLDSGVSVTVPDGADPDSKEGQEAIRQAAKTKFIALLSTDSFDVNVEPYQELENE